MTMDRARKSYAPETWTDEKLNSYRRENDAHMHVWRLETEKLWTFCVRKSDTKYIGRRHSIVELRGRCATKAEAQQAADAALPSVLRAYDALGVQAVG